jgi:hypothetical protein
MGNTEKNIIFVIFIVGIIFIAVELTLLETVINQEKQINLQKEQIKQNTKILVELEKKYNQLEIEFQKNNEL